MPDVYSIADAILIVFYTWSGMIGIPVEDHPAWTALAVRTMERPTVETAFRKDELRPLFS